MGISSEVAATNSAHTCLGVWGFGVWGFGGFLRLESGGRLVLGWERGQGLALACECLIAFSCN